MGHMEPAGTAGHSESLPVSDLFQNSVEAQGKLMRLENRIRDIRDWLGRVPVPPRWAIFTHVQSTEDQPNLMVILEFPSVGDALFWSHRYTRCHDDKWGAAAMRAEQQPPVLTIPMPDFTLQLSYPQTAIHTQ